MSALSQCTTERHFNLRSWCSKISALVPLPCRQRKRMFVDVTTAGVNLSYCRSELLIEHFEDFRKCVPNNGATWSLH